MTNCSLAFPHVELRKKNAAKKSGSPKESNQKGKRKEPPVADKEDSEDGSDSDEGEDCV